MTHWTEAQERRGLNYYRNPNNFCRFCGSPYRIFVRSKRVGYKVWNIYYCGSCGHYYTIVYDKNNVNFN